MRLILMAVLTFLSIAPIMAQSLPGLKSIEPLWPEGETRTYVFTADSTKAGSVTIKPEGVRTISGVRVLTFAEKLDLTIKGLGQGYHYSSEFTVDNSGQLVKVKGDYEMNGLEDKISAFLDRPNGKITVIRGKDKADTSQLVAGEEIYLLDNLLPHQFELALATKDLKVGRSILVSVFSPQRLYVTDYEFEVVGKTAVRYGVFADSVWQVNVLRPGNGVLFIDRLHRLVRYEDKDLGITAELEVDPFAARKRAAKPKVDALTSHIKRLPVYGLLTLFAVVWLLSLGRESWRNKWSYVLLVAGGIGFVIVQFIQTPFLEYYGKEVLLPAIQSGNSVAGFSILPALVAGILREVLVFAPLFIYYRVSKNKSISLISLGAFAGAGYGLLESFQVVGPVYESSGLMGAVISERFFAIMFNMSLGALIGFGLKRGVWWQFLLLAIGLQALSVYSVVLVQAKALAPKQLQVLLAICYLVIFGVTIYLYIRERQRGNKIKKGRR